MRHARLGRAGLAAASAITLTLTIVQAPASAADPRTTQVASDAAWIRSGQLADGAIAWYVDREHINPYIGNYAAIGLAEAYKVTRTTADLTAATSWLKWYAAHENASGFVTDYDVSPSGVETSTGDMDSTDAYAGTFLLAARAAWRAGASGSTMLSLAAGIRGAAAAIEATQDSDGLTWAKPTWHVKYLMDQSEAYAGLRAATDMASAAGDRTDANRWSADASAMSAGVASLWDAPTGAYDWARQDGGGQTTTNWANLYSDSMEQAWAATFGLATPSLITSVTTAHPDWAQPAATDTINGSQQTVGYWPVAGWGLLRDGLTTQAAAAAASIRPVSRDWPFTTAIAGQLIVLESGDLSLVS